MIGKIMGLAMRVLITGSKGMLGRELMEFLGQQHDIFGLDLPEFDLTKKDIVRRALSSFLPNIIIHAAAYTDVDASESEPERAYEINVVATRNIAAASNEVGAKIFYMSTDYVFDGEKTSPYVETDLPAPLGVYAKTKYEGEMALMDACGGIGYVIIRSSWLFGPYGKNFVKTIIELAKKQGKLRVVNDQTGSPTYTLDLAQAIEKLFELTVRGVIHICNSGECSWWRFTKEILKYAGLEGVEVEPITTEELNRPAPRPKYSVLSSRKFERLTQHRMTPWPSALKRYLEREGLLVKPATNR